MSWLVVALATLAVRTANCSVEVGCLVVPTVQLVSLEVANMVHCLGQLTQEGSTHIPLLISSILSAVVLLLLDDLVRLRKTMKFQWVHLVELADG